MECRIKARLIRQLSRMAAHLLRTTLYSGSSANAETRLRLKEVTAKSASGAPESMARHSHKQQAKADTGALLASGNTR